MSKKSIHPSIKERLGYDPAMPDKEFLADWKRRATHVCKPCWELKYCPYGPFVEQSPLLPPLRAESVESHKYLLRCLETGLMGEHGVLTDEKRDLYSELLKLSEDDRDAFAMYVARRRLKPKQIDVAIAGGESIFDALGMRSLPPIHQCRVPFSFDEEAEEQTPISDELQMEVEVEIQCLKEALASNTFDDRRPLDPQRRALFESETQDFDETKYPEEIPEVVADMACNIFGHICPVVFVGENISETSDKRRRGRYISFSVKMRVVRRDNYTCQECGRHLKDDEVEFDHIIPVARGGSSEEQNIRLTCYDCNRDKSDSVEL
jgi:hypothetical protein